MAVPRGPRTAATSSGLADRLLAERLVQPELHAKAIAMERRTGKRIEECLLELGALGETDLLRHLAAHHKTRFVTTEKLANAHIPAGTLAKVPCKVAERYGVVPVLYDEATNTLSIATADPDNVEALDQARKGAGAREVQALVARPAAVEAAIMKFYRRDPLGFAAFQREDSGHFELGALLSTGGSEAVAAFNSVALDIGPDSLDGFQGFSTSVPTAASQPVPVPPAPTAKSATPGPLSPKPPPPPPARAKPPAPPTTNEARVTKVAPAPRAPRGKARGGHDLGSLPEFPAVRVPPEPDVSRPVDTGGNGISAASTKHSLRGTSKMPGDPTAPITTSGRRDRDTAGRDYTRDEAFLETLNVLVTLLENARTELRGHSAQVARLIRKIAERMGFGAADVNALVAAAYIHDLGKSGAFHLTALNVAEYEGPRAAAQKAHATPTRLLVNLELAPLTTSSVQSMYERFDGTGLPDQKTAKEIPVGARLLAIVDTFVDLTTNAKNPFRRALKPAEACEALARYNGSVFDPALVDLVRVTATGDDLRARLLADRRVALLVDPDPEETIVLELRLLEGGFEVRVARDAEQAMKVLETGEIEIVVAEIELGASNGDGLSLLARARKAEWGRTLPWLILSRRQGRSDAQAAFAQGVIDFVTKPAPAEVLVAKLKQALENASTERAQRGVAGSLSEMGIPDLVQILFYGRKSGVLRLRRGAESGDLYFGHGMVVDAVWGNLRGEEAFYDLLRLREGEFSFDPSGRTSNVTIAVPPESLLLEGLRRMDEA